MRSFRYYLVPVLSVFFIGSIIGFSAAQVQSRSNPLVISNDDPLPRDLFVEMAKLINPSIVSIAASMSHPRSRYGMHDPFWQFFEEYMGPGRRWHQEERKAQTIGTGFIIDPKGLIVTNNHVALAAPEIKVQLIGDRNKLYDAEIVGTDERTDVALLKIEPERALKAVQLGSSKGLKVGEWVAAFGNPYGHNFSISKGIISAKGRRLEEINSLPFLQTDASINPGNSGGPLVDSRGFVVGVNTAIDARAQGIGFAIPIDHVKELLPQLKKHGKVIRGYIGIRFMDVSIRAARELDLESTRGALVVSVLPGGPADKGGLEPYDVIVKFEDKDIRASDDLKNAVLDHPVGKTAKIVVVREGQRKNLSLKISEPPNQWQAQFRGNQQSQKRSAKKSPQQKVEAGFKVVNFNKRLARKLGIDSKSPRGPIIQDIDPRGPAAQSGLKVGDIIIDVNRKRVKTAQQVYQRLKQGTNLLRVTHDGQVSLIFMDIQ
jgi:serine protease Do